ncbi:heme exporter protein CcmD [Lichenibacterium minor]|uniref:Heme exporter protein D n=1 Tax=Lichenibacterium minor TaxID=2316528 RepID=A0A4Q2U2U9_9HYPH|nr:heme exporter protein CcmD [Lichenibacterium minor]RYC30839.1 heme exporter protein CcmD [Lichenibacterium minor]
MSAIPHIGSIVAAYAVTAVVLGGTVAAVLLDRRSLRRTLERLEARAGRGRAGTPR